MLAGADPDHFADRRDAVPGDIEGGDVAPAVHRGGEEAEVGEVLDAGDPGAARGGSLDDGVLGREAGDAQLEDDVAAVVGDQQFLDRVEWESRNDGRQVEQAEPEVEPAKVNPAEITVRIERHLPSEAGDGVAVGGGHSPGSVLVGGKPAPAPGDEREVAANDHLSVNLRIARYGQLALDHAVFRIHVNDGAGFSGLWGGEY